MKKLLNTLFVTRQGAYIFKEGETAVVRHEKENLLKVPLHTLEGIICFGNVLCSPFLLGHCAEKDVTVSFLSEYGRFLAKVQGPVSGNVLLRREQYRRTDDDAQAAKIAGFVVVGKLANCRTVLRRALRDHSDKLNASEVEQAIARIENSIKHTISNTQLDSIRGYEGDGARAYFQVFNQLILTQKDGFVFQGRNRRPPLDNVNCLLSFIYTLALHDIRSALESVGLDPAVGFLHRDRPGRPGLALDLVEEFRPFFADRLVLSIINLNKVNARGFEKTGSGAVNMNDDTRKSVLIAYQERKQEEITHPFIQEKVQIGQIFFVQAMLFARYLRGELDAYPPFIWK